MARLSNMPMYVLAYLLLSLSVRGFRSMRVGLEWPWVDSDLSSSNLTEGSALSVTAGITVSLQGKRSETEMAEHGSALGMRQTRPVSEISMGSRAWTLAEGTITADQSVDQKWPQTKTTHGQIHLHMEKQGYLGPSAQLETFAYVTDGSISRMSKLLLVFGVGALMACVIFSAFGFPTQATSVNSKDDANLRGGGYHENKKHPTTSTEHVQKKGSQDMDEEVVNQGLSESSPRPADTGAVTNAQKSHLLNLPGRASAAVQCPQAERDEGDDTHFNHEAFGAMLTQNVTASEGDDADFGLSSAQLKTLRRSDAEFGLASEQLRALVANCSPASCQDSPESTDGT